MTSRCRLNKSFKVKCQQRSAIIDRSDVDVAVVLDSLAAEVNEIRLGEADERRCPSPPVSYRELLASRVKCSERNRHHSTCRDLAGREPKRSKNVTKFLQTYSTHPSN